MNAAPVPEIAALAAATGRIALDTEFVSEGRYFARLCLVQLAVMDTAGEVTVAVVDVLAEPELDAIASILAEPSVEVVVHAGQQDLGIVHRHCGVEVTNVFDTQIAASLTSSAFQPSYGNLVTQLLGVEPDRSEAFTSWDARPLTPEQLAYAGQDVEHLLPLADVLRARAATMNRQQWVRAECQILEKESVRGPDPEARFLKLAARLDPRSAAVARELVHWREETARSEDRPIRSVLQDRPIVELALRRPEDLDGLKRERGIHGGQLKRYAKQILLAIRRGLEAAPIEVPRPRRLPRSSEAAVFLCEALVRARCEASEVATSLVATRPDLEALVLSCVDGKQSPAIALLEGWRRDLVGDEVLQLLQGRRSLSVAPGVSVAVESL